ncbi:MAG: serine protease [Chryseobacterium sp.]|nr:serine protease [Candidatus Chryseobacterium enterohippi]
MFEFLENLEPLHKGFWYIAIATSFLFLLQTIMTFTGSDTADSLSDHTDGDLHIDSPFQLFSLRNLINFLLGFGWTGVAFYDSISSTTLLIIISLLVGIGFVLFFFFLIAQILKLTEDNTFDIKDLIGRDGEVYLTIPSDLKGKGKVLISSNGTQHELQAMTESNETIVSGDLVRVLSINEKTLIVTKI